MIDIYKTTLKTNRHLIFSLMMADTVLSL